MKTLSRSEAAEWAAISMSQLEYFAKLDVSKPDVGNQRKRFSIAEARLLVVAGCALENAVSPKALKEPIAWLREFAAYPEWFGTPETVQQVQDTDVALIASLVRELAPNAAACDYPAEHVRLIAQRIYAWRTGAKLPPRYASPIGDNDWQQLLSGESGDANKRHAERALREARDYLEIAGSERSYADHRPLENAVHFDTACLARRDLFLSLVASDDGSFEILASEEAAPMEGRRIWTVIDIRQLFADRGVII